MMDVAYSPDGGTLATGGGDRTIIFWEVAGYKKIRMIEDVFGNQIEFSPDGKQVVVAGNPVQIRDVESGRQVGAFSATDSSVFSASFNHDGSRLGHL